MLAFIQNNKIEKYPISLDDLQKKYPNTSFSLPLIANELVDFGVVEVEISTNPEYNPETQRLVQQEPKLIDGKWVVEMKVEDLSEEEINKIEEQNKIYLENSIREQRNQLLRESDWTQLPTGPLTQKQKDDWESYRQSLRDISSQSEFPFNVVWPTI